MKIFVFRFVLLITFLFNSIILYSVPKKLDQVIQGDLEVIFKTPPEYAKPGVLWMWMGTSISKKGITKDLEALKEAGFGRVTMFHVADVLMPWAATIEKSPTPDMVAFTDASWQMVRFAALEAKRLGLDFGIHNCPGYESSGGKWITPEKSMQMLCFSETLLYGGKRLNIQLPKPRVSLEARHNDFFFPMYNPETKKVEIPIVNERETYYKDVLVLAAPADGIVSVSNIIDLTDKMSLDGSISMDLPIGKWKIYRFGHTTKGISVQPAQWEAAGFECDKMNREAISFHMDYVIGELQSHMGDLIGNGISHLHFDSYEAGTPTWTPKMREEFRKYRNYDLDPFLLTFAGRIVESEEVTNKFKDDFSNTIKDLYRDVYFTVIKEKLKNAKLDFLCEPYGGAGVWRQHEVIPLVDRVMTEFWTNEGKYYPIQTEETVAALRLSGQNLLEAEAFTGRPQFSSWCEYPAWLKSIGDEAYCKGINRMVLHRFTHQPWDDKYKPGNAFGQHGTHFDRTQTWWKPGTAFFKYMHRCQALLLWGKYASLDSDFEIVEMDSANIQSIRRSDGKNTDVFFVANIDRIPHEVICSFAIDNRRPELWDPVTGEMRSLDNFKFENGRVLVPLKFEESQSFFIVFRRNCKDSKGGELKTYKNFPSKRLVLDLSRDWSVTFDSQWGGPNEILQFSDLVDWTDSEISGIKYYSGTASYVKKFDFDFTESAKHVILGLGTVNYIAEVRLNGVDLGVVWCAPWEIKIPKKLFKSRNNILEIKVTNVWSNRLVGDDLEPEDCIWEHPVYVTPKDEDRYLKEFPDWFLKNESRPSKGRYCFTVWDYSSKKLMPSGLLGPVTLNVKY